MADIPVKIYRSNSVREGTSPSNPSFPADQDPVIENPAGTGTPDHNSLNSLQGGNATERYHLTKDKAEAAEAANAPTSSNPFATVLDLDDYVPYSGATQDVDLGVQGITTEWVKLNTTPVIPTDQGSVYWDEDDNVLAVVLNGAIQKVGEVTFYNVKNQTGSTIPKGTGVGFAGVVGSSGRILVAPFLADGSQPSIYYVGITAEAILDGEDGKVYNFGPIRGLNTSAFSEGNVLYASSTVAGGFTTTPPTTPNNVIVVAAVLTDSATVGSLLVRVTAADLGHPPVSIGSPSNGLSIIPSTQVLSIGTASSGVTGALSGTDWNTFNGKIGGTIASGQIAFGTGTGTIGGDGGLTWDNTLKILDVNGDIVLDRGLTTIGLTRTLIIGGARNAINGIFAVLKFQNYNNLVTATDFIGSEIASVNDGSENARMEFRVATSKVLSTAIIIHSNKNIDINGSTKLLSNLDGSLNTTESLALLIKSLNNSTIGYQSAIGFGQSSNNDAFGGKIAFEITSSFSRGDFIFYTKDDTVSGGPNNEVLRVTSSRRVGVNGVTSPTNTLDVNGTTRIRSIDNASGNFLTTSATGVIQQRTAGEVATDIGAVTITGTQTIIGEKTFNANLNIGNTALDYVSWDNTSKTFGIFSQAQYIHKYRGGASGSLNMGQYDVDGNASINNTSNAKLLFGTNNITRLEIGADGDVLFKKVDNGVGNFLTIDASTGQIKNRTASEAASDLGVSQVTAIATSGIIFSPDTGSLGSVSYSVFCSIRQVGRLFFLRFNISTGSLSIGTASGNISIEITSSAITDVINSTNLAGFRIIDFTFNSDDEFISTPTRVNYLGSYKFGIYKNTGNIRDINTETQFQASDLTVHSSGSGLKNYISVNAIIEVNS